jgi:cytochrome c oxidase assembly protein subunit 15
MRRLRLSPRQYYGLTVVALVMLAAIVVTGALVRLTDSGLGCSDWPRCNDDKVIDVSSSHAAIEQINRLFTGLVAVAVILAVAGSLIRRPRRTDLVWLSLTLVLGVIGQAIVGGIVVLTDLNPIAVQQHFLLSMAILAASMVLCRRARLDDGDRLTRGVSVVTWRSVWALGTLTAGALVTGTVVTGAGPHSGQHEGEPVPRFDVSITTVARIHGITVLVTIATALVIVWAIRQRPADAVAVREPLTVFLLIGVVQAGVGYIQYLNDIPVALVAIHVTLATGLWLAAVHLVLSTFSPTPRRTDQPKEQREQAPALPVPGS